eukprot:scaffold6432_cov76-Amphora_coffeaeformis.AAC.1
MSAMRDRSPSTYGRGVFRRQAMTRTRADDARKGRKDKKKSKNNQSHDSIVHERAIRLILQQIL